MKSKLIILLGAFLLFSIYEMHAQDSLSTITVQDAFQMKTQAKNKVSELNDLLNNITIDADQSQIDFMIENSYKDGGKHKIFVNEDVIINEDIHPLSSTNAVAPEFKVKRYLSLLDIHYKKTSDLSIECTYLKTSNPRRGYDENNKVYPFVTVFFTSYFKGKHKSYPDDAYHPVNRCAEVKMVRENGFWKGYIQRIRFFSPDDTLQTRDVNDITIIGENVNDSTMNSELAKMIIADENQRIKEDLEKRKQFTELIGKGDVALEKNDFTAVFDFYLQADKIIPGNPIFAQRMKEAKTKQELANYGDKDRADNYIKDAKNAEQKRNYQKAITCYNKAIQLNEELKPQYQSKIAELNTKWDAISVLEDKYNDGVPAKELLDEYNKAIKKNKENSDLYLGRARCYDKLDNIDKAINDCITALQKDEQNLPALKLKADLLQNDPKDYYNALQDYRKYLTKNQDDSSIYELAALLKLKITPDDYASAIKFLEDGISYNNKWTNLHYRKGLILVAKKDFEAAKKSFSDAIMADKTNADAFFERGKIEMNSNKMEDASEDFSKAILNHLDSAKQKQVADFANNFYLNSKRAYSESKPDSALIYINKAVVLSPLKDEYNYQKGLSLLLVKKYEEAVNSFDKAISLNKNNAEAFYQRGVAYSLQYKWMDAHKDFTDAIRINNLHLKARKELGDAYFFMENRENEAIVSYNGFIQSLNAVKNAPEINLLPEVYNRIGLIYMRMNNPQALENFSKAIDLNKNYTDAIFNEGNFHFKNKDYNSAIKDFEKALSYNNTQPDWNFKLGMAYQARGKQEDFQKAVNCYKLANQYATDNRFAGTSTGRIATCLFNQGDYKGAIEQYKLVQNKGLLIDDKFEYELGCCFLNTGQVDSSLVYLDKAFVKDSTNDNTAIAYAAAKWTKGYNEEALRLIEKVIQAGRMTKKDIKNTTMLSAMKEDNRFRNLLK